MRVACPSFGADGRMPKRHTGFGGDVSPEIVVGGIRRGVASLAVVMDDLDAPFAGELTHWLIWNLPPEGMIPEGVPAGAQCVNGARQGLAYGRHRYRGLKQPPFTRKAHRYRFCVYALDGMLTLPPNARKTALLAAMSGHVLQTGEIVGWYRR